MFFDSITDFNILRVQISSRHVVASEVESNFKRNNALYNEEEGSEMNRPHASNLEGSVNKKKI